MLSKSLISNLLAGDLVKGIPVFFLDTVLGGYIHIFALYFPFFGRFNCSVDTVPRTCCVIRERSSLTQANKNHWAARRNSSNGVT